MDVVNSLNFSKPEIKRINRCRLYLRCITISDLCDANGTRIFQGAFDCLECARMDDDSGWPIQVKPGKKHIATWKKFIRLLCKESPTQSRLNSTLLETPMDIG